MRCRPVLFLNTDCRLLLVVEERGDLARDGRHDGAVEKCVETGEQERADDDGDEDCISDLSKEIMH